jgi:hypothetical protein
MVRLASRSPSTSRRVCPFPSLSGFDHDVDIAQSRLRVVESAAMITLRSSHFGAQANSYGPPELNGQKCSAHLRCTALLQDRFKDFWR